MQQNGPSRPIAPGQASPFAQPPMRSGVPGTGGPPSAGAVPAFPGATSAGSNPSRYRGAQSNGHTAAPPFPLSHSDAAPQVRATTGGMPVGVRPMPSQGPQGPAASAQVAAGRSLPPKQSAVSPISAQQRPMLHQQHPPPMRAHPAVRPGQPPQQQARPMPAQQHARPVPAQQQAHPIPGQSQEPARPLAPMQRPARPQPSQTQPGQPMPVPSMARPQAGHLVGRPMHPQAAGVEMPPQPDGRAVPPFPGSRNIPSQGTGEAQQGALRPLPAQAGARPMPMHAGARPMPSVGAQPTSPPHETTLRTPPMGTRTMPAHGSAQIGAAGPAVPVAGRPGGQLPSGAPSQYAPGMPQQQRSPPGAPGQGAFTGPPAPARANPASMRPLPPSAMRPTPPGTTGASGMPSQYGNGVPRHPAGIPPQGKGPPAPAAPPAQRLSSSMMPRPCALERPCGSPRRFHHRGGEASAGEVPSANTDYVGVDDGSARLRFMRLTTGSIGAEPSMMSKSGVPFALVLSPFADPVVGEAPVPVVDLTTAGGGGPLRCERCNAYANPGFKFLNGGSQFQCNLCTHVTTTPAEHYSPIAPATGDRMDADTRHEFRFGSVEYLVGSSDYCMQPPKPASYIYAFDISASAVSSGLAAAAVSSVKAAIAAGMVPGSEAGARIGIMTFDRALHFYDGRGCEEGRSVSMQVVPDVSESFVPLGGDALLLTPAQAVLTLEAVTEIHGLATAAAQALAQNPQQPQQQRTTVTRPGECALGACLGSIKAALSPTGGKAFVIAGSLPSFGPGKLERRGGALGGGEDREMALLREAVPEYEVLGCEMADAQISLDLFLAPSSAYVDAATLVRVPRACGGRLYLFPGFDPAIDGASLHRSLCAATGSVRAFEALLRVRTSVGIETTGEYVGHFGRPQRGEDVSGPVFDATSALALELSVVSKLQDPDARSSTGFNAGGFGSGGFGAVGPNLYDEVCVQAAVLFTDPAGRRRIRVHTVFASKTTVLADVFKNADVDATATFLAKKAATAVLAGGSPFSKAREALVEKMTQALFVYRKHCTSAPLSGQLILPEALKVLPVMILGLTKSSAFKPTATSAQASEAISVDERVQALSFLTWALPADIAAVAYPRMFALNQLPVSAGVPMPSPESPIVSGVEQNGLVDSKVAEPIALPNTITLGAESLEENGILLMENALRMVLWVGTKADGGLVNDIVSQVAGGRLAIRAETAGSAELTKSVSDNAKRIAAIIQRIVSQRTALSHPQVVIRQAAGGGGEPKFVMPLLVEDKPVGGGFSYVEFLRHVHKRVMDKLANESAQNEAATWEMLNHGY